ncbi:MAG: trypsin-like peptidase domain-containing protein [Bradyrhizobium sp.]|nr:trypsin-like peptidase domain-containing protein [Bradyrhizobium sp.]
MRGLAWMLIIIVAAGAPAGAAPERTASAESIYAQAPPRLLQIRTLVAGAGRQASIGSGFLVSADGLAITNYHVVSQFALEPQNYRLEYAAADGSRGEASLLAVDLANDLAVVRIDKHDAPFFSFNAAAIEGGLPKGERLYSMGNPLDLGFSISEGTYNGPVEHSYNERIHFTGALNPGMSGGPTVTADDLVVGVNVSTQRGGQLVSFLVPARFAAALLQRVHDQASPPDLRAEVARQLVAWRGALYRSFEQEGFRASALGPYRAPEAKPGWFTCWGQTNAGDTPKPRASIDSTNCSSDTSLFVASDLNIGAIQINHSHVRTVDLNQFQLAAVLTRLSQPRLAVGGPYRKWYTPERCHEDFVSAAPPDGRPPLRVIWCARAYREFDGLYDVALTAVTQDDGSEALVSRFNLQAVGYDDAMALGRHFLEALQVVR